MRVKLRESDSYFLGVTRDFQDMILSKVHGKYGFKRTSDVG